MIVLKSIAVFLAITAVPYGVGLLLRAMYVKIWTTPSEFIDHVIFWVTGIVISMLIGISVLICLKL